MMLNNKISGILLSFLFTLNLYAQVPHQKVKEVEGKEDYVEHQKKNNQKSPFEYLNKNWGKLSKLAKAKELRKFLGSDPNAWVKPDGTLPPPHYLSMAMNPMSRSIAEDFALFNREKIWRVQISSSLGRIVFLEQMITYYEKSPRAIHNKIKRRRVRKNQSLERIKINLEIKKTLQEYQKMLKIERRKLKDIIIEYKSYDESVPIDYNLNKSSFQNSIIGGGK